MTTTTIMTVMTKTTMIMVMIGNDYDDDDDDEMMTMVLTTTMLITMLITTTTTTTTMMMTTLLIMITRTTMTLLLLLFILMMIITMMIITSSRWRCWLIQKKKEGEGEENEKKKRRKQLPLFPKIFGWRLVVLAHAFCWNTETLQQTSGLPSIVQSSRRGCLYLQYTLNSQLKQLQIVLGSENGWGVQTPPQEIWLPPFFLSRTSSSLQWKIGYKLRIMPGKQWARVIWRCQQRPYGLCCHRGRIQTLFRVPRLRVMFLQTPQDINFPFSKKRKVGWMKQVQPIRTLPTD